MTLACAGSKTGARVSPESRSEQRGLAIAVVVCALAGAATVGATLTLSRGIDEQRSDAAATIASEEYGRRLLTDTSRLMGPDHEDPARRHAGIRMACASCHLGGGTEPGTLSLLQTATVYPRFSGRDGRGDGSAAGELTIAPTNFRTQRPSMNSSLRAMREGVRGTRMASWTGRLSESEIVAVAAYVRSFFEGDGGR